MNRHTADLQLVHVCQHAGAVAAQRRVLSIFGGRHASPDVPLVHRAPGDAPSAGSADVPRHQALVPRLQARRVRLERLCKAASIFELLQVGPHGQSQRCSLVDEPRETYEQG